MSDRASDAGRGAPPGGGDGAEHPTSGSGPANWMRGVAVVVVAVVIGVLLMPSATRAPLTLSSTSQTTTTTVAGGTTSTTTRTTPTTATTLPAVVPGASSIRVLVANATSITGLAGGVASYLHSRGYVVQPAVNATTKVTATQVYAASGQQAAAGTVAGALGLSAGIIQPPSAVVPVASTGGAAVIVIAGPDLGRLAPGASASTTTGAAAR